MIQLTEKAHQHLVRCVNNRPCKGIRIGVKPAGCSGMMYVFEYDDMGQQKGDWVLESNDYNIFIDTKSQLYLNGVELDYVKEGLNEGFQFNNPNEKDRCGCGESFTI
jgi:iron-sulfur cluster assembly protein